MEERMTQQNPEQPTPPASTATPQPPATAPEKGKQPPWGDKPENFDADKAWELIQNLRNEKGNPDQQLRSELQTIKDQQAQQRDALASALGLKPEETSDVDALSGRFDALQQQIVASERRAAAAEHKVPESLLTATDAESIRAQAVALAEFAQGAHYAAATVSPPPAFQANPGQGQSGSATPEQQRENERQAASTALWGRRNR